MPLFFKEYVSQAEPYVGGSTRSETTAGKPLHKMSSNENPLGSSPKALAAIRRHLDSLHEYQFQDDRIFTEKLSEHFNCRLTPEQFLPANGGMELLDIICRALLGPGTSCILSTPTFMAYQNFSLVAGARMIDVPLTEDYALDVQGILKAVDDSTRIVFIANPNNPTGRLFPDQDIRNLISRLPDHVVVVYDEVYHHYVDRPDYARAMDFILENKNLIGLHSFSKAYGLAGIRLAYLFSTPEIAGYLRHFRRPFMMSCLSVEAGMAALDDREHIDNTRALIALEKLWLYGQLDELGISYSQTDSNFILFHPPTEADLFAEQLLRSGVMLRTAGVMGAPGKVRLTIGNREMNEAFVHGVKLLKVCKV